jgi:hypothetical protein
VALRGRCGDRLAPPRLRLRRRLLTAGKLLAETREGDVETPLRAGQAYARPVGVEHNIVNASEGEFAFVEVELK